MDNRVLVPLTLGIYKDHVLCNMVPLITCHVLLAWSWYLYRNASYDHEYGKKTTLVSLAPMEIQEDQLRVRRPMEVFEKEKERKMGNKSRLAKLKIRVDLRSPPRDKRGILGKYMGATALINFSTTNKCEDERQK